MQHFLKLMAGIASPGLRGTEKRHVSGFRYTFTFYCLLFLGIFQPAGAQVNYIDDCSDLAVPVNVTCGNIIANPSFEYYTNLGEDLYCTAHSNVDHVCHWMTIDEHFGSPNFIHSELYEMPDAMIDDECDNSDLKPPVTNFANQGFHIPGIDATQNGYIGLFTYDRTSGSEWREYIMQHLLTPIPNGQTVSITFYMSLGDISTHATTLDVGFYSTAPYVPIGAPYQSGAIPAPAMITSVGPVTDRNSWVPVTATVTNTTGTTMNYIVIGNFKGEGATEASDVFPLPTVPTMEYGPYNDPLLNTSNCYYLIDDITVEKSGGYCCNVMNYITNPLSPTTPVNISSVLPSFAANSTVFVDVPLIIDQHFSMNNVDINFGPNGYIKINPGKILSVINGSYLRGCDNMWRGIDVTAAGAHLTVNASFIDDAYAAITSSGGNGVNSINSTYNNNYIGIYLKNYSGNWPLNMSQTFINCSGTLKPCTFDPSMTNTKAEAGMMLENAGTVKIKPSGASLQNKFQNLNNGIKVTNTNYELSNIYFLNIKMYDGAVSYAVTAFNTGAGGLLYSSDITNATGAVTFKGCDNGVITSGQWHSFVSNALFMTTKENAITASVNTRHSTVTGDQVRFNDNNILSGAKTGILLEFCWDVQANIYSNTITMPSGGGYIPQSFGIHIVNPNNSVNGCMPATTIIYKNSINGFEDAIRTAFAPCLNIQENIINLLPPSTNQHRGIFIENSAYAVVQKNTVTGNGKDWRNQGIRFFKSTNLKVFCNTVKTTGYGFWFDQFCDHSSIHHNFISDYQYAMFFINGCVLGPQGQNVTYFVCNKNSWQKLNATDIEFQFDNSNVPVNPTYNKFYFEPSDLIVATNKTNMNVIPGTYTVALGDISAGAPITSSPEVYCGIAREDDPDAREKYNVKDLPVIEPGSVNETNYRWMMNQELYNMYQSPAGTLNSEMEQYVETLPNNDIAQLAEVDKKIQLGEFEAAAVLNRKIVTTSESAMKLKDVNELLIGKWKNIRHYGKTDVTENEIAALKSIAELCPAEYGDAVLKARIFLQLHVNNGYKFLHPCEQSADEKIQAGQLISPGSDGEVKTATLHPNPASEYFTVNTNSGQVLQVKVMNQHGVVVMEEQVTDGQRITTSELVAGIYLVTVKDSEGTSYSAMKLIIIR